MLPNHHLFDHEKLEVYHLSIDFLVAANAIVENLPKGRSYLANQMQRAALSVCNNIAEGAGEFSADEKVRFYRFARRSATECAAMVDACRRLKLGVDGELDRARALLWRIVSMLVKMIRRGGANGGSPVEG